MQGREWQTSAFARALRLRLAVAVVALAGLTANAEAGGEHDRYDGSGRLIERSIPDGDATRYVHDPAGNILRVIEDVEIHPPEIVDSDLPEVVRCGETVDVEVAGNHLDGATATIAAGGIHIHSFRVAETGVAFTLVVECGIEHGEHEFLLSTAGGDIALTFGSSVERPGLTMIPSPLGLPPDGVEREIRLRLSHADIIDHPLSLSLTGDGEAELAAGPVGIPAGLRETDTGAARREFPRPSSRTSAGCACGSRATCRSACT